MTDTPQVLLAHHLKALKLPTFLREYDKLAGTVRNLVFGVKVKPQEADYGDQEGYPGSASFRT